MLVWFFYYIGNYGLLTLGDTLLLRVGYSQTVSVMIVSIQSIGFIVGSIIAIFVIDRLERKWLCIITALIWALALLVIGIFNHYYVIVILGFLATLTISLLVPIMYTYTAETFPTAYRATGTSICDGLGHLGGAFCGQIIFLFYHLFHTHYASNLAALATMAVSGVLTAFFLLFGKRLNGKHLTASI